MDKSYNNFKKELGHSSTPMNQPKKPDVKPSSYGEQLRQIRGRPPIDRFRKQ